MRVALRLLWLAIVLTGVPWTALLPGAGLSLCQQGLCRCEVCAHQKSCCKHRTDAPKIQTNCSCNQSPTPYVSPLPLVAFTAKIEITLSYNYQPRMTVVKRAHCFTLCPSPQPPRMA